MFATYKVIILTCDYI